MPGSLFHALDFREMAFVGLDQKEHIEIEPVDGDADTVSHSSWADMVAYCAGHGIPASVWPAFIECDMAVGVPLVEVRAMQPALREALARLAPATIASQPLLARVATYLARGELVFFTN